MSASLSLYFEDVSEILNTVERAVAQTKYFDLYLATLEVLRRTGIRFHHQEALDMLREAGA